MGRRTDRGFGIHDQRNILSRDPPSRGTLTAEQRAAVSTPSLRGLRSVLRVSLPVILVAAIGLAITITAFLTVNREEERDVVRGLEFRVDWRARDFQAKIDLAAQALVATATDVATEPRVEFEEFHQFTSAVASENKSIASISWAQPVMRGQRATFEAGAGTPIVELSAEGRRIPAAERNSYTPIVIENRFDSQPTWLGFDVSMNPGRRRALDLARDSGAPKSMMAPSSTDPMGPTYLVFWPTYSGAVTPITVDARRAQLKGYVVGVFRVLDVITGAMIDTPPLTESIHFYLSNGTDDQPAGDSSHLVAVYSAQDRSLRAARSSTTPPAEYSFSRSFMVRGEQWRLVSYFSPAVVAEQRASSPIIILLAGLLLTGVLAFTVANRIRQVSLIQTRVDRRTAELRKTNTQLAALIDASPYAIVCIDAESRVILWNAAAETLFGYSAAQVMGCPYPLVLAEEAAEFSNRLKRLSSGEVLRNLASHRRHQDGTTIDTSSSASAFYDAEGNLLGIMFAIEDLRERNAVQNQLRQAQKMEAIGQLTGGLAHDFNNLLGVILGNLDLLAERFDARSEEKDLTEAAIQAALRGADLIRQLLAYARRQPLAPKLTQLAPLLEATARLLRRSLGENISLELQVLESIWAVRIDVSQLESSLLNLAVNARDAMPNGGRLIIEATNVCIDIHALALNLEATPGDYVLLAVSDTGCGMSPEVLARVFEPFYTTKGNRGTGLGLSMVHGFIKQSGGHSRIYSEPGRGTTIRIYLPRALDGEVAKPDVLHTDMPTGDQEAILVVEDNAGIRDLAVLHLQSLGYRTIAAADGVSALAIIESGAAIDLLFTDVVMPGGLDGRALAAAARQLLPGLKILFTSGFTAAAASAAIEDRFSSNLLSKPYRKSELARRVRVMLDASESRDLSCMT
jgi:PAS domain S-box-containing protein